MSEAGGSERPWSAMTGRERWQESQRRHEQIYAWRQQGWPFKKILAESRARGWSYGLERLRQIHAKIALREGALASSGTKRPVGRPRLVPPRRRMVCLRLPVLLIDALHAARARGDIGPIGAFIETAIAGALGTHVAVEHGGGNEPCDEQGSG